MAASGIELCTSYLSSVNFCRVQRSKVKMLKTMRILGSIVVYSCDLLYLTGSYHGKMKFLAGLFGNDLMYYIDIQQ